MKAADEDDEKLKDFDTPIDGNEYDEDDDDAQLENEPALLGARQDLSFKGPGSAKCKCLDVVLGQSPNPAFSWESNLPRSDVETQLVIAVDAAECDAAAIGNGVSYRGYRVDGNNVVVQIEPAHPGRPRTAGAIVPKPYEDGAVYIEASKGMVHGKALDGEGLCKVGNPGPRRSAPVSATGGPGGLGETRRIFQPGSATSGAGGDPEVPAVSAEPDDE